MAHFAEVDSNNVVIRVLVVGNDQEHRGQSFLSGDLGLGGTWIQTSYSGTIRKNYAGAGYTYDATRDAFIPPQPFASWVLDEATCRWSPPTPMPQDGAHYSWNEATLSWVVIPL